MGVVFVGGNLALDFVGTLNERETSRVEQLTSPSQLADWFVRAGVVDQPPVAGPAELAAGLAVREALFRVVAALVDGEAVPGADLEAVNHAAFAAPPVVRVDADGRRSRRGDVAAALSAVARDGLDLFDRDDDAVLRWCADASCTHPFLDRSRGHRRRWCGMAGCGDRAKAAAYRARRRDPQVEVQPARALT